MISNQSYIPQSGVKPEYYQQTQSNPNQANWRPQMQPSPNRANWGPQSVQEQPVHPSHHNSVDYSQLHHSPYMYDPHHMHHFHPMMDDHHPMMDEHHPMMHEMWDEHMFFDHYHDGWGFEEFDYHHAWFYPMPMMHVHHHLHLTLDDLQKIEAAHQKMEAAHQPKAAAAHQPKG